MNRLRVDPSCCTGCSSCELACSFAKEGVFSLLLSRVLVRRDGENASFRPRVCIQCAEHPCIEACPVGALSKQAATGAIQLAEERCIGCRRCVDACPYDGVRFHEERGLPLICDLCGGDPSCVATCQKPQALTYIPVDAEGGRSDEPR